MIGLNRLSPHHRRYAMISAVVIGLLLAIFLMRWMRQPPASPVNAGTHGRVPSVDLTGAPPQELTLDRLSADLAQLMQQQRESQALMTTLQTQLQTLKKLPLTEQPASGVDTEGLPAELTNPAADKHLPDILDWDQQTQGRQSPLWFQNPNEPAPPARPIRHIGQAPKPAPTPVKNKPVELLRLPAGSILTGQLITGLDMPTSQGAKHEPFPTLIRIKKNAILPNRHRSDVRECFVLAGGYGDMSSERAYLRGETVSCIFGRGRDQRVVERTIDSYVVGEDGKAGLRGRLVSRQGKIMAKAAAAGFLGGLTQAFDIRQVPTVSLVPGSGGGQINPSWSTGLQAQQALQSSLVRGSNRALERLADFYLKLADQVVPIIEISAERKVDLVILRGLSQ